MGAEAQDAGPGQARDVQPWAGSQDGAVWPSLSALNSGQGAFSGAPTRGEKQWKVGEPGNEVAGNTWIRADWNWGEQEVEGRHS